MTLCLFLHENSPIPDQYSLLMAWKNFTFKRSSTPANMDEATNTLCIGLAMALNMTAGFLAVKWSTAKHWIGG